MTQIQLNSNFGIKSLNYVNPYPCGYLGDPKHECKCAPSQIIRYRKRISGPIIDRIDLHVEVPAVEVDKLTGKIKTESSKKIRRRVQKARDRQTKRFKKTNLACNAEMNNREIKEFCPLSGECLRLLRQAVSQLALSARGYYKIIKISRTIADLAGEEEIAPEHIAEALQYRPRKQE